MKKENKNDKNKNTKKDRKSTVDKKRTTKGIILNFLKHNYIYIIMIVLVVARIGLGYGLGGWYGMSETYDDVAMMQGLSFKRLTDPTNLALIKDLSFSIFLGIGAITRLPYTVVLSGFWALTAFVAWLLTRKVTKNKWIQLFVFAYVLFLPIAFTSWGGLRIYRNAIIAPCIILTFSLALMLVIDLVRQEKIKKTIWTAIFTGVSFAFTYFLKEDGLWLKACMMLILLICLAIIIYRLFKKRINGSFQIRGAVAWSLICLIPFGILYVWDTAYRSFNYAAFGVYEINTRTEGELGRFVENVYKIDSPNRSEVIWAPYDAIEKAFDASPTLSSHPKLLEEILTTGWNEGGIIENPIKYDFLGWVMRSELVDAGLWTTETEVNEMFRQVNYELKEAFNDGALKKAEGRIQLLSSVGGYTWDEIINSDLMRQTGASFLESLWYVHYDIGFDDGDVYYGTKGLEWDYSKVNKVLHMNDDVNVTTGIRRDASKTIAMVIVWIYRVANTIIVVFVVGFVGRQFIKFFVNFKNRKKYVKENGLSIVYAATSLTFFGVTFAYAFATAWFFIAPAEGSGIFYPAFIYYRVGVPGLLTISLMSGAVGVLEHIESGRLIGKTRKV